MIGNRKWIFVAATALIGLQAVLYATTSSDVARDVLLLLIAMTPFVFYLVGVSRKPRESAETIEGTIAYQFGNCELDTASRLLRFEGVTVDIQPRVFDLIEYLIRERGRAVSKDELFEKIWPSVVVSEGSLTQTVKRARNLFRDNGMDADIIRTVHSVGYRFDGQVSEQQSRRSPSLGPSRLKLISAATMLALGLTMATAIWFASPHGSRPISSAPPNTVVVLPFENLTSDPTFSWFSDGLSETLAQALTQVNGLRVIGRTSASSVIENDVAPSIIGEQLNVANIIEGSVQRSGDRLRVTATLLRASDGAVLWSETYDRDMNEIFEIQDAIAATAVQRMEVSLAQQLTAPDTTGSARDAYAYQLYLRGNQQRELRTETALAAAFELYREALRIDPQYTDALLALANVTFQRATMGSIDRDSGFREAVTLIRQALSIDPNYADAYLTLAEIQHRHFWSFEEASENFERAMTLSSGSASAHAAYARFLSKTGRFDEAVNQALLAHELDPLSRSANASLVLRLVRVSRLAEAREILDSMHEQYPENGDLPWLESLWNLRNESYGEALSRIADEEFAYLRLSISAIALHHLGRNDQAQKALNELIETDADGATFQIAEVYAQWDMPDQAIQWLEKAMSNGDPGLAELHSSFSFEPVYDDPRYSDLLEKIGLPALP